MASSLGGRGESDSEHPSSESSSEEDARKPETNYWGKAMHVPDLPAWLIQCSGEASHSWKSGDVCGRTDASDPFYID